MRRECVSTVSLRIYSFQYNEWRTSIIISNLLNTCKLLHALYCSVDELCFRTLSLSLSKLQEHCYMDDIFAADSCTTPNISHTSHLFSELQPSIKSVVRFSSAIHRLQSYFVSPIYFQVHSLASPTHHLNFFFCTPVLNSYSSQFI